MLGENGTIVVFLLVAWRIDGESFSCVCHLLVAHLVGCNLLQCVNPRVSNAIAELLLLSPSHCLRQHVGKSFAHNLLLYRLARTHLCLWIGAHRNVEELFVEEWHTAFNTPS